MLVQITIENQQQTITITFIYIRRDLNEWLIISSKIHTLCIRHILHKLTLGKVKQT